MVGRCSESFSDSVTLLAASVATGTLRQFPGQDFHLQETRPLCAAHTRTRVSGRTLRFVASSDSLLERPGYPSAAFFRFQRANAALRALSRRSSGDRRRARAFPPFFPSATARESLRRFIVSNLAQDPAFDLLPCGVDIMRSATHNRAGVQIECSYERATFEAGDFQGAGCPGTVPPAIRR